MTVTDEKFNRIMLETIRNDIAEAFNTIEAQMRLRNPQIPLNEMQISIIERKASQMKKELILYIDSQVERIITCSENRELTGNQASE